MTTALLGLLLGSPQRQTYNIGDRAGTASIAQVAAMVAQVFGGVPSRSASPTPPASSRAHRYVPRLEWLYEDAALVHPRVGLREGLLRMCQSLYDRGLIPRAPLIDAEAGA